MTKPTKISKDIKLKDIKLNRSALVSQEIQNASGDKYYVESSKSKLKVLQNIQLRITEALKNNKQLPIFYNLMNIVSSKEVLLTAYGNIKSNKGSTTPGTLNQTADEMSLERIEKLAEKLKNETYNFPDVRRTWIPKPIKGIDWKNKENLIQFGRPLGVPDFDAKLVQEAVRLVLNAIYEPQFENENVSYGFRPRTGCHNAIVVIEKDAQGMDVAIEGDIKGAYNNLNHEKLINILSRRILDKKLLKLIYKMCKTGIFDTFQQIRTDSLLGVPQGAIVSPLLWNIYMHEFDKYIKTEILELINTINKVQKRGNIGNLEYRKLLAKEKNRLEKAKKWYKISKKIEGQQSNTAKNLSKIYAQLSKAFTRKRQQLPSKDKSRLTIRICYLRYADDWILFTNGKKVLAQYLKNKITSYLKYQLGLTLSNEKTKITKLTTEPAKFLGFEIKMYKSRKFIIDKNNRQRRIGGNKPILGIDKKRLLEIFEWRGFIKKGKPREQPAWSTLSDYEIVIKYNSIIRGLVNYYYPLINYKSTTNYFIYILEYSCYKTMCQKHRTTIRKLIKKYGHPLKVKNTNGNVLELLTVRTYAKVLKDTLNNIEQNLKYKKSNQNTLITSDFLNNAKTYWRTQFKFRGRCVICGSTERVEMHHIRHIRDSNEKESFRRIMSLLNRKQIPVCKLHHKLIHDGKYDNISLSELYDTRIATVENFLRLN